MGLPGCVCRRGGLRGLPQWDSTRYGTIIAYMVMHIYRTCSYYVAFSCRPVVQQGQAFLPEKDVAWSTRSNVYTVALPRHPSELPAFKNANKVIADEYPQPGRSGEVVYRVLTHSGNNSSPSYSPLETHLAYIHRERAQFESDMAQLKLVQLSSGVTHHQLTRAIDLSFECVEWVDEWAFYTSAQYHGSTRIFRVQLGETAAGGVAVTRLEIMNGDSNYSMPRYIPGTLQYARTPGSELQYSPSYLYFLVSSLLAPPELVLAELTERDSHLFSLFAADESGCVTDSSSSPQNTFHPVDREGLYPLAENQSHYIRSVFATGEEFTNNDVSMPAAVDKHYFRGAGGEYCQAWYLPPVGGDNGDRNLKDVPLAVIIHGGPQGATTNMWHYRWNMVWVYGCMGVWLYECMGVWLYECMVVWVYVRCILNDIYVIHSACLCRASLLPRGMGW